MPKYTMHVVSHTHWDREWYLPFQLFRQKLVDLMDRLLDLLDRDPDFKYFTMDGQSIMLKDYLEIRPENEAKLREYIRQGRIIVGPWYLLNDQFLVSAEANVRCLLVGMKIARDFGGTMMVGYSPDQFGNTSQLPQILQGFGIDNAIFGRGFQIPPHPKMEFLWESPDGTQVLAAVMPFWYNNAQHIPANPDEIEGYLNHLKERMAPIASVPHLLLMNGVDHLEAQYDVSEAIRLGNEKMKDVKLVHSTLQDYIDALKAGIAKSKTSLEVVRGELREDDHSSVLAGTLSSRMYIKQANEASLTWLERYAEPMASCAWMLGTKYPAGELTNAWKMLMQNHAHDSICGCSTDQVHKEMMIRNDQVDQIGEDLTERATKKLVAQISTDSDSLIVFNTLAWKRTDKVTATVDFPIGPYVRSAPRIDYDIRIRAMELRDSEGNLVPFAVVDVKNADDRLLDPGELPMVRMVRRFTIEFIAEDVPACGYKTYKVAVADRMPKFKGPLTDTYWDNAIISEKLSAAFSSATGISIETPDSEEGKDDGSVYFGLNIYEDGGDAGDEYRYMKPIQDIVANSLAVAAQTSIIDHSPISATHKIEQTLMLPESATPDGRGRSEKLAACPITTYVTVTKGSPRVDFRVEVENNAKDHRLRVLFPTQLETDCSHAEGQFDVVTRPIAIPEEWQFAATSHPQQSWVDVNDGTAGFCVINKGLPEYELYDDTSRTLALTLLRCVNRLAGGADSTISRQVPEAQCLGKQTFEYAVLPHAGDWENAQVWRQAHQHNVPFYTVQTEAHDGPLPSQMSFVEVEPAELVVTGIKKAENDDRLIVRFFNTTDKTVSGKVTVRGAKSAELTNLDEEPQEKLKVGKDGSVKLKVAGKKIVTVGFGF